MDINEAASIIGQNHLAYVIYAANRYGNQGNNGPIPDLDSWAGEDQSTKDTYQTIAKILTILGEA